MEGVVEHALFLALLAFFVKLLSKSDMRRFGKIVLVEGVFIGFGVLLLLLLLLG